jgi:hypothetical protein
MSFAMKKIRCTEEIDGVLKQTEAGRKGGCRRF